MSEELTWMPAWQIRDLIAKREVSPVAVTEHFLGRIEQFDGELHSFAFCDVAGARAQAKRAEQAVLEGAELGALHGVPVSIKGHVWVEGLPSYDMNTHQDIPAAPRDELQVERLRDAGAIVFGTNTLMGSGADRALALTDMSRMYNWDVEARSAWDRARVPGWSSSGTASAVSAGLVPLGLGSDGGGSTRLPSAYSGLFGVATTPGRIPWVLPGAPAIGLTASTGTITRDVVDGALATQVLAGPDGRDLFADRSQPDDYLADIEAGVSGLRFAWSDDLGYASKYALEESPRVIAAIREAAKGFEQLGATVEPTAQVWDDFHEGFQLLNQVFGSGGHGAGGTVPAMDYWASMETRKVNVDKFTALFEDYDVLLTPTTQLLARTTEDWNRAWTVDHEKYTHGNFYGHYVSHVMIFNWLSMPAFSVPCGLVDGLPIGLQVVGKPGAEKKMFQVARAFQQAFPMPKPPGF